MLELYLGALGVGGTLLVASLVLGGHHEGEASGFDKDLELELDADVDADVDADADHSEGIGVEEVLEWLPVTSIRFWTFFLAFFGATGTVLTLLELGGSTGVVVGISGGLGYACGLASTAIVKSLRRNQTDSSVRSDDMVGATVEVKVGIGKDRPGKVRAHLRGRIIDRIAHTDDAEPIEVGARVMVIGINQNGDALVTARETALGAPASEQGANG